MEAAFGVALEQTLNQFEAAWVDVHTGAPYTVSFNLEEPVLYHPPHLARPTLTHVGAITKDYFVVGTSTTQRMIPIGQAQKILKFKLTFEDIEREVHGDSLDAGERMVWRRWLDCQNLRLVRKSRVRAPCCGRVKYRYQLEADFAGHFYCDACWQLDPQHWPQDAGQTEQYVQDPSRSPEDETNPNEAPNFKKIAPPWRRESELPPPPPAKRSRLSVEGKIQKWTHGMNYGFAIFDGFGDQQIYVHSKDVEGTLSVGDCVEAIVRRRDDGKLRAYEVIARPDPEKVHATLMGMS
jgi:hypothetical protein